MPRALAALLVLLLALPDLAHAVPEANRNQFWYRNSVFVRVNPLGAIDFLRLGYKRRLEVSDTAFGRDTYAFVGASVVGSPAFGRVGVHAEVQPVALLQFAATYEFVGFYGTFDQLTGFRSTNTNFFVPDFGPVTYDEPVRSTYGHTVTLLGEFKFKLGPVAVRNTLRASWWNMVLEDGEVAFYDQVFDRLVADNGWMLYNDLDVLGVLEHARFGARYTWSDSLFGKADTGIGNVPHHRLGPLLAWQFHDHKERSRWDKPTLFFLLQWWLQHPYRTGQEVSQAFPVITLGLTFEGDLLWKGPPAGRTKRRGKG